MRRFIWVMAISVVLILTSCQFLPSKEDLMDQGTSALQNGNLNEAEEKFNEVLQIDPNDPNAHAALALIYFFKAYIASSQWWDENATSISEPVILGGSPIDLNNAVKAFRNLRFPMKALFKNGSTEFNLGDTLDEITQAQEQVEENIIPNYEKALEHANAALAEGNVNLKIYPNRLDMDGDGTVEPDTPMKFITNKGKSFTMEDVYKCTVPELDDDEVILIDQTGGDAWFDYHLVVSMISSDATCGDPVFNDEDDYLTVDDGDMHVIKSISGFILGYLYLFVTYNFDMPDEAINVIEDAFNNGNFEDLISYFDADENYIITNQELQNKLGDFLTFREKGEQHLSGSIEMLKTGFESALDADEEIESDPGGDHNFTSHEFFPDYGFLTDDNEDEFEEAIGYLTDQPIPLDESSGVYLNLFVLKNNPNNFSDLKDFFPDIHMMENKLVFPDPTFGGLLNPGDWDGTWIIDE